MGSLFNVIPEKPLQESVAKPKNLVLKRYAFFNQCHSKKPNNMLIDLHVLTLDTEGRDGIRLRYADTRKY